MNDLGVLIRAETNQSLSSKFTFNPDLKHIYSRICDPTFTEWLPDYENAHKIAREWYPWMPKFGHTNFPSFLVSSRELVLYVHQDKEVTIRVSPESTASADQDEKNIVIPTNVFDLVGFGLEDINVSLATKTELITATLNGLLLHEAAHFARSPVTISEAYEMAAKSGTMSLDKLKKSAVALTIFNVVEDIYIENWLKNSFPSYKVFIEATHNFYFHELELARRMHSVYETAELVEEGELGKFDGPKFLDLLIAAKNWRYQKKELWGSLSWQYVEKLLKSAALTGKESRAVHAAEITKDLMTDPELEWPPEMEGSLLALGMGGDKLDGEGKAITVIVLKADMLRKEGEAALTKPEVAEIVREFRDEEIYILVETDRHEVGRIPPAEIREPSRSTGIDVKPDKRFLSFGKQLRRSFTHNEAPGEPQRKGQILVATRLYRIATDQKIFSYRERRKAIGKDYEIIILVDCSGSMSSYGKIEEAMNVGVAAWQSLRSARIHTQLLGHSTIPDGSYNEIPVVYVIGDRKEPMNRVLAKASDIVENKGRYLKNNIDGYALLKAAERFSDKPTRKWLIHINDGQPAGAKYSGEPANAHTSIAAKRIRKREIDVVCITIERGADDVNDRIYGERKNVKTASPKALKELLVAMFAKGEKDNGASSLGHS